MKKNFYIYFDIKSNSEIIKYRKLMKEYILESDDDEILNDYFIDNVENPYHIVDSKLFGSHPNICEKIFINDELNFDIIVQPIGTLFIDFLNVDLNDYNCLKNFVFKYGLDLFLNMDKSNTFEKYKFYTENEFDISFNKLCDCIKKDLIKIHNDFIESVIFCFQDSGNKKINLLDAKRRYFLSFHKSNGNAHFIYKPKLQIYSNGIATDFTSFYDTEIKLQTFDEKELIKKVSSNDFAFTTFSYTCLKLENVLFISFINLLDINNLHINTCANCGKLFIPLSKSNEKYCNYLIDTESSRTCKDVGADKKYKEKIKDNEIISIIRSTSSTLSMRVKRNPDIKEHEKKYNTWKEVYPIQMQKYKNGEITKDELINWINNVRR